MQIQGFVEHKPARPRKAAHVPRLRALGHEFKLEGLEALHAGILISDQWFDLLTAAEDTCGVHALKDGAFHARRINRN